jgi:hypothetical protein
MGKGHARTKVLPTDYTINMLAVAERRDGRRIVIDANTNGTIRATVGTGAAGCPSSMVESDDPTEFTGGTFCENFDEECPSTPDPYPYY